MIIEERRLKAFALHKKMVALRKELLNPNYRVSFTWFWKGGESLVTHVRRGKSEHHRARCRVTPVQPGIHAGGRLEDLSTDSATEKQTAAVRKDGGKGEKVR